MAECSSLTFSIQTPRLKIEQQSEMLAQWLALVQSIVYSYMCSRPNRKYMVEQYIRSLEDKDNNFLTRINRKLGRVDSKSKLNAEKKFLSQYLKIQLADIDLVAREPLWLQRFLYQRYPALHPMSKENRNQFRDEILSLTDLEIMYGNLQNVGGGRGRTPTGSFTEAASQYFTSALGESPKLDDQIMLKIWGAFTMIKGAIGTLESYQRKSGIKPAPLIDQFCTPLMLFDKLEALGRQWIRTPRSAKHRSSAIQGLDHRSKRQTVTGETSRSRRKSDADTNEAVSIIREDRSDLYDMAFNLELLIKDVGIAIIKLTEVLSLNKRNLVAQIWKYFNEFGAYEKSIRHLFKEIGLFLEADLNPIRSYLTLISQYLAQIDQELKEVESSDVELAMEVLHHGFENPLNVFKLEGIQTKLLRFKDHLRCISIDLSENRLSLSRLKDLSNLFDSALSALELIQQLLKGRQGDKTNLTPFYLFVERWKSFYDAVDPLEQKLILNYSLEYNLHQAWIFIERINTTTRV